MEALNFSGRRVWVAGHRGMVGSSISRRLASEGCTILTVERDVLDLRDQQNVYRWLHDQRPDTVVLAAAKVGGILANDSYPADFLLDNLLIETAIISGAHAANVDRLLFLGSSCIYPKMAPQPIVEDALLTGPLEPTNEWYAIAKIAGIKLVQAFRRQHGRDYISAMPTNLYGPGDNFDLQSSHVLPALIRKVHKAKETGGDVVMWGTGQPRRELLYVDDCADACIHLLKTYSGDSHVNVGSGVDLTILELTQTVMKVLQYDGRIVNDLSKPDGTPRKLMDNGKLKALGWTPKVSLEDGIARSYEAYLNGHYREARLDG